jgi:hypothetical protein
LGHVLATEANVTAILSPRDRLTFKYRQWEWVSSTGKLPLYDSFYELSYRRKWTDHWSFDLAGRIQNSDYTSGNSVNSLRNDWQYTIAPGLTWTANRNVSLNLACSLDFGRNGQDNLVNPGLREFDHYLASLGAQFRLERTRPAPLSL